MFYLLQVHQNVLNHNVWANKVYFDLTPIDYLTNSQKFIFRYKSGDNWIYSYGNSNVDAAIKKVIERGNMTTLNAYEDVILANKLLKINPWADMAKFTRTGGEANAVAMRIARASTKKNKVAICGYHGWHDWYLSTNLNFTKTNNLNSHLMNNLEISGVPKKLKDTVFSFHYGDYKTLLNLVKRKNIGVIKMEICRNTVPNLSFLKKVRNF